MSAFEALKSACKASVSFKSFSEIEVGVYDVQEFKFVETKFGKKLVVRTEEFLCFLPERFSKAVSTDNQLIELNAELNSVTYSMKYDGKDPKRKSYIVDFIKTPKMQDDWPHELDEFLQLESNTEQK